MKNESLTPEQQQKVAEYRTALTRCHFGRLARLINEALGAMDHAVLDEFEKADAEHMEVLRRLGLRLPE